MSLLVASLILIQILSTVSPVTSTSLLKRRYLTFPKGSSLSIAICMTVQTGLLPGGIFTEGLNWGIAYDLPGDAHTLENNLKLSTNAMRRQHRRDLYERIETILYSLGYDGRSCVLRAICETQKISLGEHTTIIDKLLHIIFSYPLEDIQENQEKMALEYYYRRRQWS